MQTLAILINERGWSGLRSGVELDNYYFSAAAWETLKTDLPEVEFLDATSIVNWQRAVKSETEIEYMRRAARIVETMHRQIVEIAEPGMRKNDLVAEIYRTSIKGCGGHWGDWHRGRADDAFLRHH